MNNTLLSESVRFITRTADIPTLDAFYFTSWSNAKKVLNVHDFETGVVVSDLSQGAWKGHWIADELLRQLADGKHAALVQPMLNEGDYADTVAKLIDNESAGDQNFSLSLQHCMAIKAALQDKGVSTVMIIPPPAETDWEEENLQLVRLMCDAFKNTPLKIVLCCYAGCHIPGDWKLNVENNENSVAEMPYTIPFVAGIFSKQAMEQLGVLPTDYITLRNGQAAINPLLKRSQPITAELVNSVYTEAYLRAACFAKAPELIEREEVEQQALLRFAEGGYGVALRLLSGLLQHTADEYNKAILIAQMQNMRIALLRFAEAAAAPLPQDTLPDVIKASLYQSKAWGLVMSNKPAEAEPYFELARNFLNEQEFPRLYLYLLNISALNKLRIGEVDTAFAFEKRIEQILDQAESRDWHITYINYINQARLYKKIKDYAQSEAYYDKAFAINARLKNESDLLYTNFCYAQLEDLKQNHQHAFLYYFRACIHWLSNPLPESLAPRVAQAILNKGLGTARVDVERISEQLESGLLLMAQNANVEIKQYSNPHSFYFCRSAVLNNPPDVLLGQPGWSICAAAEDVTPVFSGVAYNRLSLLVSNIIRGYFHQFNWDTFNVIATDTQFNDELPANLAEMLLSARRLKVAGLVWDGKLFKLTAKDYSGIEERMFAAISPAINFVTNDAGGLKVYFRRYEASIVLSKEEANVLNTLQREGTSLISALGSAELVKDMEEKRLIQTYYE